MRHAYGWVPDVPDSRDYLYSAIKPKRVRLQASVDLRKYCSKVEDQGRLGSCTAQALAGNLEFLDRRGDSKYVDISRLFIYYNERVLMKTVSSDSGAMLRDGIKTLNKDGVCAESSWPYRIVVFKKKPSEASYREARSHRIQAYHRILSISDVLMLSARRRLIFQLSFISLPKSERSSFSFKIFKPS